MLVESCCALGLPLSPGIQRWMGHMEKQVRTRDGTQHTKSSRDTGEDAGDAGPALALVRASSLGQCEGIWSLLKPKARGQV